ncbi:DUF1552 domain-containing protein [Verrucomicrobia bacterium]|jgi:hypothetical protein|nr:DUF1552 domain-containing protein [Verrucomicrobiota bacterium]MDA7510488.1 DUF1552 domain-containing protein [Verrucomicrobiota bacterium]MDA7867286.1 DUF1552 domain-containing protein [Verrucomicrobiota bacterium]MDB4745876.1 DUF1552 domain-containing protein [Verrucomicrobiota bacterium]
MKNDSRMNRRTCLKGVGASLALPLLDSMGWAEETKSRSAYKPPVRLGFMYMPHGVIMDQFWPATPESYLSSPPPALQSLRPVLDQCLMMKGISGVPISPFNGAPHALELSTWLTATLPDADTRSRINIAISADQIAANYVGALTSLPSLELATMPQTHKENQAGLNEAYYSHCSFRSPTQPVLAEINPRNVLNRLFGKFDQLGQFTQANSLDRQMLDLVIDGAKDLRRKLPQSDQHKLDEYLDSVRAVERRIAAIEYRQKEAALEKSGVRASKRHTADSPPIEIKIPEGDKRSEYMQVMCDLNVLAFQTDTTRVSTYIGSTPNGVSYPELGFTDRHHSNTHHNFETEKVRKVAAITEFNIAQFAYMVKKMHGLREGDGTLLDNCIMMWGSGLEDGNKHLRENLPFIVAGRGGGSIRTGRFLSDTKGNQGDLLTTLLACAQVPLDRPIGIATKEIKEMKA